MSLDLVLMRRIAVTAILGAVLSVSTPPAAEAVTISFSNADLSVSTSNAGPNDIPLAGVSSAFIPAIATFTQPFDGNVPDQRWYRFSFALPAGFTSPAMHVHLSVDNEVQLFLNGQTAAVESDSVVENFSGGSRPEFALNSNGTVTNTSGTWNSLPISQTMFQAGANELIFFAVNTGGLGAFALEVGNDFISFDAGNDLAPIPEPSHTPSLRHHGSGARAGTLEAAQASSAAVARTGLEPEGAASRGRLIPFGPGDVKLSLSSLHLRKMDRDCPSRPRVDHDPMEHVTVVSERGPLPVLERNPVALVVHGDGARGLIAPCSR